LNNKKMIRLSLSREVEGKRPDEARQPAKKFFLCNGANSVRKLKKFIGFKLSER